MALSTFLQSNGNDIILIRCEGTETRALFSAFSPEMLVAQSDQYRTQAEIKALDKAVAEVRFLFFFFC